MKRLIVSALIIFFSVGLARTQEHRLQPEWWFGGSIGMNLNYYNSDVRVLNGSTTAQSFTKGAGTGLFLSPLIEYRPDPVWGGMLQFGFDGRSGSFDDITVGATTQSLTTSMNYLSLEPSLRISPFPSSVYFFAGPRIGFNVAKSFTYSKTGNPDVTADWSGVRGAVMSLQLGVGYEFPLSPPEAESQINVSPFLAIHFGQGPRAEERWGLTSVRLGVSMKVGSTADVKAKMEKEVQFSVRAPKVIPVERKINETFPMRNYVFFDEGSSVIPARYIILTSGIASSFKEEQLLQPEPNDLTGRSKRQMKVYHNILNILGDRMRKYPQTNVTLAGASEQSSADARVMADAVKQYLVGVFGIEAGRITAEGRDKPTIPSFQPGGTRELELVRPEDRRVDITSSSAQLLEPVQIVSLQEDPIDSDVLFSAAGAQDALASWSIEVTDEGGNMKRFGPYTSDQEGISGKTILGDKLKGNYSVALVGETKNGQSIRKESSMRLLRSEQPAGDLGLRFSILFEFDQSKTVSTYERFLTGTVAPLIPKGGNVAIHGHTDIVGEESHNLKLSRDRAQETMQILQREVVKAGKKGVKFDAYGFGEEVRRAPFDNLLPEERFYNRTVIIDIVPE